MTDIGGEKSKKDFLGEAEDLLKELNNNLEELEDTYQEAFNPDVLNAIFRGVHSLKGISGIFGFNKISEMSHRLESLLDSLRLGKIELDRNVLDLIVESLDVFKKLLDDAEKGEDIIDTDTILSKIDAFMTGGIKGREASPIDALDIDPEIIKTLTEYEEHRFKANLKAGKEIFLLKASFNLQSFDKDLDNLNKKVKPIGEVITTLPSSGASLQEGIRFTLLVGSSKNLEEITDNAGGENVTVEKVFVKKGAEAIAGAKSPGRPAEAKMKLPSATEVSLKSTSKTVRVDIERLDRIMNTVGELVLTKTAVSRISKELREIQGYSTLALDLQRVSQVLEKKLVALQNEIIEVRMVPVGQIFSRLTQVVRRYSREVEKEINLEFYGEDTELDKFLAEEIADPLMHIIKNAIDHGIESLEKRKGLGKKEKGTVRLRAFPKGSHVAITIEDDGGGIDLDMIFKKAVENGMVERDAILNKREILEFLFIAGFTTKKDVTEVSGRGVGLDVVKTKVSDLSGFIDIDTELGIGTTFTITLPMTLAIIKALIISVANQIFAIPLTSVSESLMVPRNIIQRVEKKEVLELRGEMLPLIRLDRTFQLSPNDEAENMNVVVVGFGDRRIGLIVDELRGQHEIVIKTLGESLRGVRGISGAAELGRYQVILVLDVEALIEEAMGWKRI